MHSCETQGPRNMVSSSTIYLILKKGTHHYGLRDASPMLQQDICCFGFQAIHHLGIPTTRAGTCVTSDTKVIRDIFYDGHPIQERASVVLRIAPTFIRSEFIFIYPLMIQFIRLG